MNGPSSADRLIDNVGDGDTLDEVRTDTNTALRDSTSPFSKIGGRFLVKRKQYNQLGNRNSIDNLAYQNPDDFRRNSNSLDELINLGLCIDYIDLKWYGWEAIHYAAYSCDSDKLRAIVDSIDPDRINTLTALSENALHILLEHGRVAQSFNISCQNGLDLKMSKIINQEQDSVFECAKILIGAKIDVNHNNFWNETPILIAIKRKYYRIVKMLCQVKGIDLDSCRGAISGKTAREHLKEKVLPKHVGTNCTKTDLFQFLKAGDEEGFLKCNSGKISKWVDSFDGDKEDNSSCTLLQYCFRRGMIAWYQEKRNLDCDVQLHYQDITSNRLVQVFCQNGMAKCIQHLLDNGASVDFTLTKFENGRSLLEVAIVKSYYPLVALILGRKNGRLHHDRILQICNAMLELLQTSSDINDLNNTITLVLNRLLTVEQPFDYFEIVDRLMELLEKGVKIMNKENILQLLKFPGSLCPKKTVLEEIHPEVLNTHLDECIEQNGDHTYVNYGSFMKNHSVQPVLQTFLDSESLHEFFGHPVFKILITRKWDQLQLPCCGWKIKYFSLNLWFHVLFYFLLNIYIVCKFNNFPVATAFQVMCILGWVIFVLKEVFQLVADPRLYITEKNNYVEVFFIIVTFIVYVSKSEWVDALAVLSVLSSNLVVLLLLQQVPSVAKYIIILQTIVYYLRYMGFYFLQFLAFAVCFYILFAKTDQVFIGDFLNKIFETVILFTGNLDYMDTPPWKPESNATTTLYHNFPLKEAFSKIIFVLFVVFLAIILQNLLLGLLVTDMSNIHKTVKLYEQKARASFVVRLEAFLESPCVMFFLEFFKYCKEEDKRYVLITEAEKTVLDEVKRQAKNGKRVNPLKKLYNYIKTKMNERNNDSHYDSNKDLLEKLELLEERIKTLQNR